jgi:LAO/AO transport system kinase
VPAAARLISLIEANEQKAKDVLRLLFPHTGKARVLGITGPPGAGKSTLVRSMIAEYRARNLTVGILAIDPSSPFTAGALLGDRVRMGPHATDRGVFIRSMASRGHLGGITAATPAAIRVLDAMGLERIIIETVGVGQSEVAVAATADCTVLVLVPGAGDAIQTIKAGVMEIADVFVVNKSDRDGAMQTLQEIRMMLQLRSDRGSRAGVLSTRADRGEGVDALVDAIEMHFRTTENSGQLEEFRLRCLKREALDLIGREARRQIVDNLDQRVVERIVESLRRRQLDPAGVAAEVLAAHVHSGDRR